MAVLADYLRRRRELSDEPSTPRITPKRVGLAVAAAVVGAAAIRWWRRRDAANGAEAAVIDDAGA